MARDPLITRNFRVSKEAWDDALATADAANESFSEALRDFVDWYAHRPRARAPWRPAQGARASRPTADDSRES